MKIALFGSGKTGGKVLEVAREHEVLGPFTRSRPASLAEVRGADVVILFVPGPALPGLLPFLLEAGVPVVSGATGRALTHEERLFIAERGIPWIQASNFSLGMNLAFELARRMGHFLRSGIANVRISETHHVHKLDSPSGTAISLREAFGRHVPIESKREGDVVGIHELLLCLPGEELRVRHEATDRRVFAEGALWAAKLLQEKKLSPGVHRFEDLVRAHCFEGNPV